MTERRTVSVIAHELGHWWNGDVHSDPAAERRAWRFAGVLLIDPPAYLAAEREHHHPGAIASNLGVLVDVVHGYRAEISAGP